MEQLKLYKDTPHSYKLFINFNGVCCSVYPSTTKSLHVLYILAAYGGEFCEEDRNGCSEIQCFQGVECLDVPAPGVGAMCGECPEGYTGDGEKCFGKIFDYFVLYVNFSPSHN